LKPKLTKLACRGVRDLPVAFLGKILSFSPDIRAQLQTMMQFARSRSLNTWLMCAGTLTGVLVGAGCSSSGPTAAGGSASSGGSGGNTTSNGGSPAGSSSGGSNAGGATSTGGATNTGGAVGNAGAASGGSAAAGASSGGTSAGGSSAGGSSAGGSSAGGSSAGGAGRGGTTSAGGSGAGGSAGGGSHTGVWRIMPLGDSITAATCYPQLLSQKLKADGHTNFSLIGSILNNHPCTNSAAMSAPNVMTEGHSGDLVTCLTGDTTGSTCTGKGAPSDLTTWLAARPAPDVVLMHFGTNDAWTPSVPIATITGAYTKVLTMLRQGNPNVILFVAQILPMHPACTNTDMSTCPDPDQRVMQLNAQIPAWASSQSSSASPVYVVNIYGSVDDATYLPNTTNTGDTGDGVHPNNAGSILVANTWEQALISKSIP
jgi:lysophospholipase L1-like esterase